MFAFVCCTVKDKRQRQENPDNGTSRDKVHRKNKRVKKFRQEHRCSKDEKIRQKPGQSAQRRTDKVQRENKKFHS